MEAPGAQLMTAEEFFLWASKPGNQDRFLELENGLIVESPLPGEQHGAVCSLVAYVLGTYHFTQGKGYLCTNCTGLIVRRGPDTVRGPDVMPFDEKRTLS